MGNSNEKVKFLWLRIKTDKLGRLDKYNIDLKGMQADFAKYEFQLDKSYFNDIDGEEIEKGNVDVVVEVRKVHEAFLLHFYATGIVYVPCDLCLDDMELPVESEDELTVKFGDRHLGGEDDLVIVPYEEGFINVAWLMYELVALSVPMKHVHEPGMCNPLMAEKLCEHMCPGSDDENEDLAGTERIDPRWNELKKILDNN